MAAIVGCGLISLAINKGVVLHDCTVTTVCIWMIETSTVIHEYHTVVIMKNNIAMKEGDGQKSSVPANSSMLDNGGEMKVGFIGVVLVNYNKNLF